MMTILVPYIRQAIGHRATFQVIKRCNTKWRLQTHTNERRDTSKSSPLLHWIKMPKTNFYLHPSFNRFRFEYVTGHITATTMPPLPAMPPMLLQLFQHRARVGEDRSVRVSSIFKHFSFYISFWKDSILRLILFVFFYLPLIFHFPDFFLFTFFFVFFFSFV